MAVWRLGRAQVIGAVAALVAVVALVWGGSVLLGSDGSTSTGGASEPGTDPAATDPAVSAAPTGPAGGSVDAPRIYIAGDSTAAAYPAKFAPRTGWGQALPVFLNQGRITVHNWAKVGASTKSFIDEGRLTQILAEIRKGDYLLIGFGHNDERPEAVVHTDPFGSYQANLRQFVDGARSKGAVPVLVSPAERYHFDRTGRITPSHGEFPAAMRQVAVADQVPLIDLTALSTAIWNAHGPQGAQSDFLWLAPGASPNYPDGVQDKTHFQTHGAIELAQLVAKRLDAEHILPAEDFQGLERTDVPDSALAG
ncbi:rhamnogalacturonan acetylesterase [Kitasatospora sp. GP82]|uniref:rhamnogalacturonan acetylesterase n=1 Tax=Kitasatospora sp. GP82 TaxID=3035089 RepID=UPI002476ED6C|nr:rhamnogalacturonan acetylesterase [Kitasatospora sp. GP82]MDH6127868.1 lysophospholipase L1-like esterase [Kitasatospora sp. GP82]